MKTAEPLHACPHCGRKNFTTRGLKAHVCRPSRNPSPMAKPAPSPSSKSTALAVLTDRQISTAVEISKLQSVALQQLAMVKTLERDAALRAILVGLTLHRIKASLKHGEFMPWMKKHLKGAGKSQANNYMRLALVAVEKSKATKPELLALPGDQTELALDRGDDSAKRMMGKLAKFVGEQSLNDLLREHGIKETAKRGGARTPNADDDTPEPPTPEELAALAKTELAEWLDHGRQLLLTDNLCSRMLSADIKAFAAAVSETLARWRRGLGGIVEENEGKES